MAKPKNKPLKRFNGQGTVYKLPGRRRRPWVAQVTTGWEVNEETKKKKRLYHIIGYFEEKNEAETALLKHQISPISPKSNITLEELYIEWSDRKYKQLAKGTSDGYKAAWKRLQPLKSAKFADLRTSHFQEIIDKSVEENLSKSTITNIKAVVVMLYNHAMKDDIVNKNYGEFITLPNFDKKERNYYTDLEITKIEKHADEVPYLDTVLILIYTGMRITEMTTLTKFNIDIENMIITGGIKTEAGKNRTIPIHPKIQKYIRKWYDKNGESLICDGNGKKISSRTYREKYYADALNAIGIRVLKPHECRHTFATLLSKAGVKPLYIQKLIGHTDYATTANIYTHTDIEELRNAIKCI
jgi:integrase